MVAYGQRIAVLEEKMGANEFQLTDKEKDIIHPDDVSKQNVDPYKLINIIKTKQQRYVKESYGIQKHQAFTEEDLDKFEKANIPLKITKSIKNDSDFIDVVLSIKKLPRSERQDLIKIGFSTYKRTWGEIGKISKDGQTDAGQLAEKMISSAIMNLVVDLVKKPNEEIEQLYPY